MHKPSVNIRKDALILTDDLLPAIVMDDIYLSPIRFVKIGKNITSIWADEISEVDAQLWRKAIVVKIKTPK